MISFFSANARSLALALLFACSAASLRADELKLKSGEIHRGRFTGIEKGLLKFKTNGRTLRIPITRVRDLKITPKPAPAKKASKPAPRRPKRPAARPPVESRPKTAGDTPKGRPEIPAGRLPEIPDSPPTARLGGPAFWPYLIPGVIQIRSGRRKTGTVLLTLFGAALLNGLYEYGRLLNEIEDARRDPLFHSFLNPRGGHRVRLHSLRNTGYLLAGTYLAHGIELGRSVESPRPSPGTAELRLDLSYRIYF